MAVRFFSPHNAAERALRLRKLAYKFDGDWQQTIATLPSLDRLSQERAGQILSELVTPATRGSSSSNSRPGPPVERAAHPRPHREAWNKTRTYR